MELSILIPTYNRGNNLRQNLLELDKIINGNNISDNVEIIVANNCSTDNTNIILEECISHINTKITIYNHHKNIGLEANALFVLSKASSKFIMFLGDDDYLHSRYLLEVLNLIRNDKKIGLIIPSYLKILPDRTKMGGGRDLNLSNKFYKKGFYSSLRLSWRGHQLSGIVLFREELYEAYKDRKVSNIYPFIFFVALCAMNHNSYHLTSFPVEVTQPGQEKKDWNYGEDGLLTEVFDNFSKLPGINYFQKSLYQIYFFYKQRWRILDYQGEDRKKAISIISKSKQTSKLAALTIRFMVSLLILKSYLLNK
jgi:glycosyltransferase involved in cell wall biosynthesis